MISLAPFLPIVDSPLVERGETSRPGGGLLLNDERNVKNISVFNLQIGSKSKFKDNARTPGIVKGNKSLKISHLVWFK